MSSEREDAAIGEIVTRIDPGRRASIATILNGTGYFAVTPDAPYDGSLDIAVQTRQLLAKAEARLVRLGGSRSRLAFVTIILADMADYQAMNAVWDEWVADIQPPARACFEAKLASPDLKVEMIMVCATGK